MKVLKWCSLFFMSVFIVFIIGMFAGARLEEYLHSEDEAQNITAQTLEQSAPKAILKDDNVELEQPTDGTSAAETAIEVSGSDERINADTVYIIIERNMDTDEEVESISRMPEMYLGMDREQFLISIEEYEANPPLIELERGFVSLEVQSFSSSKVEVLMNYSYVKPSTSFYVVVYDGLVTILLEDKETVYLQTGMQVLNLPEYIQQELIQGMYVPDEESLYDFLENYTS